MMFQNVWSDSPTWTDASYQFVTVLRSTEWNRTSLNSWSLCTHVAVCITGSPDHDSGLWMRRQARWSACRRPLTTTTAPLWPLWSLPHISRGHKGQVVDRRHWVS